MKLKSFYEARAIVNRTNWEPTDWEKVFTNLTSERGLIFKIQMLTSKDRNNPIKKNGI